MFCLQEVTQSLLSYLPPSELHTAYILTWSMCAAADDTASDDDSDDGANSKPQSQLDPYDNGEWC